MMYFPEGQLVQLVEANVEYFPKEQVTQDDAVVGSFAFFPASQLKQDASSA